MRRWIAAPVPAPIAPIAPIALIALIGLALAVGLAGTARAWPGKDEGPRSPRLLEEHAEELGLSPAQRETIRGLVDDSREAGRALHEDLRRLHDRMRELLTQDQPDLDAVMAQADAIGNVETELQKLRLRTMMEIRAQLTPEQRQELSRLREDLRDRWGGGVREACDADVEARCPGAEDRFERMRCLRDHREELSEACREALECAHRHHGRHHRGPRGDAPATPGG